MNEFENKLIETRFGKIEVSRVVASWHNMNGKTGMIHNHKFNKWMARIGVSEEDRRYVINFASNGNTELEVSAGIFRFLPKF